MGRNLISEIVMILAGAFLVIDGLFIHAIVFDYSAYSLGFLDPYISHTIVGAVLLMLGAWDFMGKR